MTNDSLPPAVILVRPQEEGNVGAVARAMANMGLDELILVAPQCELGRIATAFAVNAAPILEARRTCSDFAEAVAPFQRLVATSSSRGRTLNRSLVSPRELPALLAADPTGTRTALVFGGERSGLGTDELTRCDPLVTIPAAARQPTLNLSQAVLILAYELWATRGESAAPQVTPSVIPRTITGTNASRTGCGTSRATSLLERRRRPGPKWTRYPAGTKCRSISPRTCSSLVRFCHTILEKWQVNNDVLN